MRNQATRGLALACLFLSAVGCDEDAETSEMVDVPDIVGTYVERFDGGEVLHEIGRTEWTMDFGGATSVLPYVIVDNGRQFVVAENDGMPGTFSKLQWTQTDDGLYYCTVAFDAASAADAAAVPAADDSDPAMGGCGGFTWSPLDPS